MINTNSPMSSGEWIGVLSTELLFSVSPGGVVLRSADEHIGRDVGSRGGAVAELQRSWECTAKRCSRAILRRKKILSNLYNTRRRGFSSFFVKTFSSKLGKMETSMAYEWAPKMGLGIRPAVRGPIWAGYSTEILLIDWASSFIGRA